MNERTNFAPGDRVRVSESYHWAKGVHATVTEPPLGIQVHSADSEPYDGCRRFVQGRIGLIEFIYAEFDEPQIDADGDGPYHGGEVEAAMLELKVDP